VREVSPARGPLASEGQVFAACLATILELPLHAVPEPASDEGVVGWRMMRWLGGLGLGLVPIADAAKFSWAGPWIARVQPASPGARRPVVMYGVPSGVVFDPAEATSGEGWQIEDGFVVAALDIALAPPPMAAAPTSTGSVVTISIATTAGAIPEAVEVVRALAGQGLEGDRHVTGKGTFPSGPPGSALTLIEAEVCESFTPPLDAGEHRRNLVTRGIDLNALVGHEFAIGEVSCRGMRLCEPCTVVDNYASRPVLRPLVHRGGLRADILKDGVIHVGDRVRVR
jgi:MOSC domain-containing protein YiiM